MVFIKANQLNLIAIHSLVEQYYEAIDSDNFMVGIFLDFLRAFDTISHKIILTKLQYYGRRGTALCLFEGYLAKREQYVCHKLLSSYININTEIPQWSILGPLLFLLYVNEMYLIAPNLSFCDESFEMNIGEMRINRTENIKFLCIVLDSRFTWKAHIDHYMQQGNSVARDLSRTGSETNTTIFVIYIYWI